MKTPRVYRGPFCLPPHPMLSLLVAQPAQRSLLQAVVALPLPLPVPELQPWSFFAATRPLPLARPAGRQHAWVTMAHPHDRRVHCQRLQCHPR